MLDYFSKDTTRALQFFHALRFGSVLLISILLVRSILDLDRVGQYEQFIFAGNLLSFFWSMGMAKAMLSYYPTLSPLEKSRFFPSAFLLLLLLGAMTAVLAYLFSSPLQKLMGLDLFPFWKESLILLILSTPICIIENKFTLERNAKGIVNYSMAAFIPIVGSSIYFLCIKKDLNLFINVWLIWMAFRCIYAFFLSRGRPQLNLLSRYLMYSFPLVFHIVLGNGMEYIDGIIVNHYYDSSTFPIFKYGAREFPISTIFIAGIVASMLPLFGANPGKTLEAIKSKTSQLIKWLFPLAAFMMLLSPWLYQGIYGEAFIDSAFLFNIYLLVLVSRILLPQIVIQAKHHNSVLVISAILEVIVNIGLSLLWVKTYGLIGIAAATWVAYFINKIILAFYIKIKMGYSISAYINMRIYTAYSLLLLLAFTSAWFIYQ